MSEKENKEFASIEYSKRLGYLFGDAKVWWCRVDGYDDLVLSTELTNAPELSTERVYPAISISMALENLPESIDCKRLFCLREYTFQIVRANDEWVVQYEQRLKNYDDYFHKTKDKSLPNALCKMLIWLTDNDLMEGE